jgi:hypothetical protein
MTDTTNQSLREQAETLLARIKSTDPADEPFYIGGFVDRLLAHYGTIAITWCIEDVQGIRPDLTAEQALEVLEQVGDNHDAEWGINWTTLETVADELFEAPETDEVQEAKP